MRTSNARFVEVFKEFFRKWWAGSNGVAREMIREVGYCVGAVKRDRFNREPGVVDYFLDSLPWKRFRQLNLFMSNAMYLNIDDVGDYGKALYDRLFYDFDSKEDPEIAKRKALEFAQSVKARFKVDPVVVVSGLHGAHIHIPLKKPINWQVYDTLWTTLVAPYSFGKLVDPQVKDSSRLHRVPYTYNIKYEEDKVYEGFSYIVDLNGKRIRLEDFDWGSYEPLDPSSVELYEFVALDLPKISVVVASKPRVPRVDSSKPKPRLPEDPAALDSHEAVPPCIRNIVQVLKTSGDPDHNQRLVLVWYLRWVGYSVDAVVDLFKRFVKDFNEKIARYQVEYAYGLRGSKRGAGYLPPSCEWMKQQSMCLNCGWNRNIATYTYARADVPEDLKQKFFELVKSRNTSNSTNTSINNIDIESEQLRVPQELQTFLRESGFKEFSYSDAKEWIEKRFGSIDASKWHSIERSLRQLAEKCILGRKFLVDGSWVDYGCGKIEKPPSKDVKFYIIKDLTL